MDLLSTNNRLVTDPGDPITPLFGLPISLALRVLQQSTHKEKNSIAAVTIKINYSKMVTMLRADTPDAGDGHAATEGKLLARFRSLVTYCLGPRLPPELVERVLESMEVEITEFKGAINWQQSRIILLFNRQKKLNSTDYEDLFPLETVTNWALQIALMIAIRSDNPEHLLIHFCPLTRWKTAESGSSSTHDISEEACTVIRVTARATGDASNTDRTPFFPVGQSLSKSGTAGIITGLDIASDPLAAILFKSLTGRSHDHFMREPATGGTAVSLARVPKAVRCNKDQSKRQIPAPDGRISVRSSEKEVGLFHTRAAERLEEHGESPLKSNTKRTTALGLIQHGINPDLRPHLGQWARDLSSNISRLTTVLKSDHTSQDVMIARIHQFLEEWAENPNTPPLKPKLGQITEPHLFNRAGPALEDCTDTKTHRLIWGTMAFVLYYDHTTSLNFICTIYDRTVGHTLDPPDINVRMVWAAAVLGNKLHSALCKCHKEHCTCATARTKEKLLFYQKMQITSYRRDQARMRSEEEVKQTFSVGSTIFAKREACHLHPSLAEGQLGIVADHYLLHGDHMVQIDFKAGNLARIPATLTYIHPLETLPGWKDTGDTYALGHRIRVVRDPNRTGFVHGFVTQDDLSERVLVWLSGAQEYQQMLGGNIEHAPSEGGTGTDNQDTYLPQLVPTTGAQEQTTGAHTCLSGCSRLETPTSKGGRKHILMREVRAGTTLVNKEGQTVLVTNVYYSIDTSTMDRISQNLHTSTTHTLIDGRSGANSTALAAMAWAYRKH